MLSVRATDVNGTVLDDFSLMKAVLLREEDVPADSLEVRLCETGIRELARIELLKDDEVIFDGDVDEQIEEISQNSYTEIVARSIMARLIDNEAYPMTLVNPSSKDIFRYFVKPCGFDELSGEDRCYQGIFKVNKGISCYEAVKRFSLAVYGRLPCAEGKTLYMAGNEESGLEELSEDSLIGFRKSYLRCERLSEVLLKLKDTEGYNTAVKDAEAESLGVNRVRYVNASKGSSTPAAYADEILRKSRAKSFCAQAEVVGFLSDVKGKDIRIIDTIEGVYVSGVRCVLDKNTEKTRLTLKRRS